MSYWIAAHFEEHASECYGVIQRCALMFYSPSDVSILRRGHVWNSALQQKEEQKARFVKSSLLVLG